jgi:hypothetical protein
MGNSNSIINLGDLAKPATVLVEKISDAIGGIFKPYQIRRIAQAEGEAEKIRAAVYGVDPAATQTAKTKT